MRLAVSGGFHSPFMAKAAEGFREYLSSIQLSKPSIPVYSDLTADRYPDDIITTLSQQISSPVRWTSLIRKMIEDGIDEFIEIGPGTVLSSLVKRIDKTVSVRSIEA